jgi:probable rRNA maturation factor
MEQEISFFSQEIEFQLADEESVSAWLVDIAAHEGRLIGELNYVFVDDEQLASMNEELLQHDTYTDILTFPLHEPGDEMIFGDIFISVDRVRENAKDFGQSFKDELHRVMAHGVLHMLGHDDLDDESEAEMRVAEDFALSLRRF